MAIIHDTTMSPGKRELLSAAWRLPDGTQVRGILATADYMPGPRPGDH
jgi:hypothetical protein